MPDFVELAMPICSSTAAPANLALWTKMPGVVRYRVDAPFKMEILIV